MTTTIARDRLRDLTNAVTDRYLTPDFDAIAINQDARKALMRVIPGYRMKRPIDICRWTRRPAELR